MDIKPAFYLVNREALWKALQAKLVPPPNLSAQGPAHWNEVMRPSWQALHGLFHYIFRGLTRLCPGARPVLHSH